MAKRSTNNGTVDDSAQVGQRLRSAREELGLSLREVARRLGLSASALSQIETGKSQPSVKTLYALVTELGLSMDDLFDASAEPRRPIVQRADARPSLTLDSGVTWDQLIGGLDSDVEFIYCTYEPGGSSSASGKSVRHGGREYGLVLSGELELSVDGESFRLGPRDSCSFASSEAHRLSNPGDVQTTAIWVVVGRRHGDARPLGSGAKRP